MEPQIIGIKQLHKDLSKIAEKAKKGQSYIVVKNSKPVFRLEPFQAERKPKFTIEDFKKIRFKGGKNLSKDIDKILYNQ